MVNAELQKYNNIIKDRNLEQKTGEAGKATSCEPQGQAHQKYKTTVELKKWRCLLHKNKLQTSNDVDKTHSGSVQ